MNLKLKKFFNTNTNKKLKKFYTITICLVIRCWISLLNWRDLSFLEYFFNFLLVLENFFNFFTFLESKEWEIWKINMGFEDKHGFSGCWFVVLEMYFKDKHEFWRKPRLWIEGGALMVIVCFPLFRMVLQRKLDMSFEI